MDGYQNPNGVGLNATEQLEYNRFIADAAHERGIRIILCQRNLYSGGLTTNGDLL